VHCSVFGLFVTWWYFWPTVGPPTNVTIEHNTFGAIDGYYAMFWADYVEQAHRLWTNFVVRDNRCEAQGAALPPPSARTKFTVGPNTGC
jgi:hypothetical protein